MHTKQEQQQAFEKAKQMILASINVVDSVVYIGSGRNGMCMACAGDRLDFLASLVTHGLSGGDPIKEINDVVRFLQSIQHDLLNLMESESNMAAIKELSKGMKIKNMVTGENSEIQ